MNRPFAPLLASVALTICAANAAHAQSAMPDRRLCRGDAYIVGYRSDLPRDGERDTAVTELTAKALSAVREGDYELTGEPEIRRADQRLAADRIHYQSVQDIAVAEGNVQYQDRSMAVGAATANVDLGRDITTLTGARYQLIGENTDGKLSRGNGLASEVRASGAQGKQLATLKDVTYSTCDPGQRDWEITARTMDLDQASGKGTARGMRLRFKDVPILALPYATFPIDDRRRSGLLLPSIGGTNVNGFDFLIPYYLNLAPNYDATLTPRLIGGRGFMAGSEFRWLGAAQHGQFSASYLPNDRDADRNRYSYTFKHSASLSPNFFVVSDINRVSDPRYFEDFGDSLAASATSLLPSSAYLHGRGSWWSMSFGGDDIEVTDPRVGAAAEPYRRLPRFTLDAEYPLAQNLHIGVRSEAVSFDKTAAVTGERYDLQPFVAFPAERAWGFVRPELAYRETQYHLDRALDRSPSRALPIASLDAGLFFDRDTTLFGHALRQTLEPRLYFLHVPYRAQDNLPIFDTQDLTFSFAQLFRPNRFTGADRQMDADQLTLAATTQLIDDADGNQILRASFGQIRYFDNQRVQLPGVAATDFNGSDYAAELEFGISERWRFVFSQLYDPNADRSDLSAVRVQYRFGERGVANFAYRFRRDLVEQVDLSTAFPINDRVRLIGRWNHSLRDDRTLEALAGLEFGDCCYAVRIVARRYVRNVAGDTANALFFELELKGLGSLGRRSGDFLQRSIQGYR